jgi:hypothetical protein
VIGGSPDTWLQDSTTLLPETVAPLAGLERIGVAGAEHDCPIVKLRWLEFVELLQASVARTHQVIEPLLTLIVQLVEAVPAQAWLSPLL